MSEQTLPVVKYPSVDEVRESLTDDEVAALVTALPQYQKDPVTLASLHTDEVSPDVMHAWAALCKAFRAPYAVSGPALTLKPKEVTRPRTQDELEHAALAAEASKRYGDARQAAGYTSRY